MNNKFRYNNINEYFTPEQTNTSSPSSSSPSGLYLIVVALIIIFAIIGVGIWFALNHGSHDVEILTHSGGIFLIGE